MTKTLTDLFGDAAELQGDFLRINYLSLLQILNILSWQASPNPNPETIAAALLMTLNITTRYSQDENGYPVVDDTQAIVSPSIEPRRSFVTRKEQSQLQVRLSFEVYSVDYGAFDPGTIVGEDTGSDSPSPQQ